MFATLLGALPRPTAAAVAARASAAAAAGGVPDANTAVDLGLDLDLDLDRAIEHVIRVQELAGLEPITDGRLGDPAFERVANDLVGGAEGVLGSDAGLGRLVASIVAQWGFAAALTDWAVKQALPGPYTLGWRDAGPDRARRTLAFAEGLGEVIRSLADAGCPLVEIEELESHRVGADETERTLFREAHRRLTSGGGETHLSLSIVGGAADQAGVETILDAPYASLAVDLIAGPDNWRLVTETPPDRGVIAAALSAREDADEPKEVLLWAAHYAATRGRGIDRVGLGSAGSYANLTWAVAARKLQRLGEAARLAALPPSEELSRQLDPRAVSARRAGLGHGAAKRPRR